MQTINLKLVQRKSEIEEKRDARFHIAIMKPSDDKDTKWSRVIIFRDAQKTLEYRLFNPNGYKLSVSKAVRLMSLYYPHIENFWLCLLSNEEILSTWNPDTIKEILNDS